MVLVFPSIELKDGACIYCIKGENGTEQKYDYLQHHLAELCRLFRIENTKAIHITDLDSFDKAKKSNESLILSLINSVDVPFQLYFDFKSTESCNKMLDKGIYRILLDRLIIEKPDEVRALIERYSSTKIACYVNAINGKVSLPGLKQSYSDAALIAKAKTLGINRVVYYENKWSKSTEEPDYDLMKDLAINFEVKITLGNGVTNFQALRKMREYEKFGLDSVIISKPLYENNFPCQKIWRLAEAENIL